MTLRSLLLAALAPALVLVPAHEARATMLTWVDGGNVWAQNLDGSQRHRVTNDGTADNPYLLPTTNDAGGLAAFHNGPNGHPYIYWFPKGELPEARKTRMPKQFGDESTSPPTSARLAPNSRDLVYTYFIGGDPAHPHYGRVDAELPAVQGAQSDPRIYDFLDISFYDNGTGPRPVGATHGGEIWWTATRGDQPWLKTTDGSKLTAAEASRSGMRLVVRYEVGGARRLMAVAYSGPAAFGQIDAACLIPTAPGYTRASISPDGRTVAWDDAAGLHLADFEPERNDGENCLVENVRTVSATGSQPAFSGATTVAPPPADNGGGGGGGTPPGGGGGGGGGGTQPADPTQPKLTFTTPKSARLKALRAGLKLKVTVPVAGRLTGSLTMGSGKRAKTVVTKSVTATKAGPVTLTLKVPRTKKLAKGTKLTVKLRLKPKTGATIERTATLKVG